MKKIVLFFAAIGLSVVLSAQIRLPRIVSDSMILQRDTRLKIGGWASPGERVSVELDNKIHKTKADVEGNLAVGLPPIRAGGPYSMNIIGRNKVTLNNVLFCDVWFCSGQSNMVHQMNIHDVTYARDIAEADYPGCELLSNGFSTIFVTSNSYTLPLSLLLGIAFKLIFNDIRDKQTTTCQYRYELGIAFKLIFNDIRDKFHYYFFITFRVVNCFQIDFQRYSGQAAPFHIYQLISCELLSNGFSTIFVTRKGN